MMSSLPAHAQDGGGPTLQMQVNELKSMIENLHAQVVESRTENMALRQELEQIRGQLAKLSSATAPDAQPLEKLEEEQQLLAVKEDEQYQTKIESASRYRVRLSGLVLINMFSNRG